MNFSPELLLGAFLLAGLIIPMTIGVKRRQVESAENFDNCYKQKGTVTETIPGDDTYGEVTLTIDEQPHTVSALANEPLEAGTPVTVIEIMTESTVRVQRTEPQM